MGKNRLAPHTTAVLAILFFAFLAIGSTASAPKSTSTTPASPAPVVVTPATEETVVSSKTNSDGIVNTIKPSPAERQYDTLGLVFVKSVTKFDERGQTTSGQEGIVTMLLREAQKLGGNDIVNLRIDENVMEEKTTSSAGRTTVRTVTYTGSALAIKYKN